MSGKFGEDFQQAVGFALWPNWATLGRISVSATEGNLKVGVFRDTDWVPLGITQGMPETARTGLLQLAEAGAAGQPLPSWAEGEADAWALFAKNLTLIHPKE